MTLTEVADSARLSVGYISQVERGLANPSLETLKRLTDAVGRTIGQLFDNSVEASASQRVAVSRAGARKQILYPGSNIVNELLSPDLRHRMEVIWVEAPVDADSGGHPHNHEGEECGVILAGSMEFWADGEQHVLGAGDSIYLSSTVPHRWRSAGPEPLLALWVITPPTF